MSDTTNQAPNLFNNLKKIGAFFHFLKENHVSENEINIFLEGSHPNTGMITPSSHSYEIAANVLARVAPHRTQYGWKVLLLKTIADLNDMVLLKDAQSVDEASYLGVIREAYNKGVAALMKGFLDVAKSDGIDEKDSVAVGNNHLGILLAAAMSRGLYLKVKAENMPEICAGSPNTQWIDDLFIVPSDKLLRI